MPPSRLRDVPGSAIPQNGGSPLLRVPILLAFSNARIRTLSLHMILLGN